jgi:hypothetical protein
MIYNNYVDNYNTIENNIPHINCFLPTQQYNLEQSDIFLLNYYIKSYEIFRVEQTNLNYNLNFSDIDDLVESYY